MATTISSATTILASSSIQKNLNAGNSKQTPNSQSLKKAVRVIHKQIIRIRKKYPLESLQSQENQNKESETSHSQVSQQPTEAKSEQNLNSSAVQENEIQTGKVIPATPKSPQTPRSVSANTLVPVESHASSLAPSSASSLGDDTTPLHHPSNLWGRFVLPVIILLLLIVLLILFRWFWSTSNSCDSEFCCDYEKFGPKI